MPLVQFTDAYRTGDPTVDGQHIELFRMFNDLHGAILAGHERGQLQVTLDALTAYVATHFQTEEHLMLLHGYPGYAVHKTKHDDLAQNAAKVIEGYRSGKTVLTIALSRFFADWLRLHIEIEDKPMIRYFQARKALRSGALPPRP